MDTSADYNLPINRAEGDLEVRISVEDGRIAEAWSRGTLYRGFENLLVGRAALDALVITPRICGICTTTHLYAAAKCLDDVAGVTVPDNGIRVRNLALLLEHAQSDVRQTLLMFMVDFINPLYAANPEADALAKRFAPMTGSSWLGVLRESKRLIEIIALLGGQWPHSSFMVPGGVTHLPSRSDLQTARLIVRQFGDWYQKQVLGCDLATWRSVRSLADLESWQADPAHHDSDLGWLLRLGQRHGLLDNGAGCGNFISYGLADLPLETAVGNGGSHLFAPGVWLSGELQAFDPQLVSESIAHSAYAGDDAPCHPSRGSTIPLPPDADPRKYSYSKAPRYAENACETGPLAEALVAGDPLIRDWVAQRGPSTLLRQIARLTRPVHLLNAIDTWLAELAERNDAPFITRAPAALDGEGYGGINAARGGLGHWATFSRGRIERYQIITPTAWNASPRDQKGCPGPWEQALVGTRVDSDGNDPGENPVAAGHVIRAFDPCLVCTVH